MTPYTVQSFPQNPSKICLSLSGPTLERCKEQIKLNIDSIDMIELRLDLWTHYTLEELEKLRREFPLPVIYTLRPERQGGGYRDNEIRRYATLQQLLTLQPSYLDIEYDLPINWVENLQQQADALGQGSTIQFIHSYHHICHKQMRGMPEDFDSLYSTLDQRRKQRAGDLIKIACTPETSSDAFYLLQWAKKHPNTLVIGMGEYGTLTRICAPCADIPWSYSHSKNQSPIAAGQLSCTTLKSLYHFSSLHSHTPLYGLLGSPVTGSISHWSHNLFFELFSIPALYLKCRTSEQELATLLDRARELGFKGFSVTHPLKEKIIPYLDTVDPHAQKIGAVNTLCLEGNKWVGYNTDGSGMLLALGERETLKRKEALILGSGGCAKAIAHTLKENGWNLLIMSRNAQTGQHLAQAVEGRWINWNVEALPAQGASLLIQATSSAIEIQPHHLRSIEAVFETITLPKESSLTQAAHRQGCFVVYGYSMFIEQALQQMQLWFPTIAFNQDGPIQKWRQLIATALSEGSIPDCLIYPKENCYD